MKRFGVVLLALATVACGGDDAVTTTTVAMIASVRHDGGSGNHRGSCWRHPTERGPRCCQRSLAMTRAQKWPLFLNAPQGTTRIVIGIDSDDSFNGHGDPDGRFRRLGGVR